MCTFTGKYTHFTFLYIDRNMPIYNNMYTVVDRFSIIHDILALKIYFQDESVNKST